jgi:hypothetical protein
VNVYPFIAAEKPAERNVVRTCALLSVSRSAYYQQNPYTVGRGGGERLRRCSFPSTWLLARECHQNPALRAPG